MNMSSDDEASPMTPTALDIDVPLPPPITKGSSGTAVAPVTVSENSDNDDDDDDRLSIVVYSGCGRRTCCMTCCLPLPRRRPPQLTAKRSWYDSWLVQRIVGPQWVHAWRLSHSYFFETTLVPRLFRTVTAFYTTIVLGYGLVEEQQDGYWFVYFTHLSFLGMVVYLYLASYITWEWWWVVERHRDTHLLTRQRPRLLDMITSVMYSMSVTFHVIVPLVYWLLLAKNYSLSDDLPRGRWMNLSQHALDLVVMSTEFAISRVIMPWSHMAFVISVTLSFILWSWVGAAIWPTNGPAGNGFPYFFVDYTKPVSFGFMAALAAAFIFIYAVVWLAHLGRQRLARALGCRWTLQGAIEAGTGPTSIEMGR